MGANPMRYERGQMMGDVFAGLTVLAVYVGCGLFGGVVAGMMGGEWIGISMGTIAGCTLFNYAAAGFTTNA